jgi:DNA polymerase I
MPDELIEQFPIVKELLNLMAIDIFEVDGFEADDLIGTLSVFAENKGIEVYIVTGDRDALQLATDNVKVVINKKGMSEKEVYDHNRMVEELGVTPTQFIDVKGLMGDTSDNIPGVPGIGEKTAYKLIKEYKSVENVLQNIDNISGAKLKQNLMEYSEQAIFSKKLATIITDVPIEIDMESIKSKENFDVSGLRALFFRLKFKSLIDKIPEATQCANEEVNESLKIDFEIIDELTKLKEVVNSIKDIVYVNFKILEGNVFSKSVIDKIYLAIEDSNFVVEVNKLYETQKEETTLLLKEIFENINILKIGHDVKMPYTIFHKMGIDFKNIEFDTKIAAYLIDSSKGEYNLKTLIEEYLRVDMSGEGDELMAKETSLLKKLHIFLKEEIKKFNMEELLYKVEQPLIEVLANMETLGFKVDEKKLIELGENFTKEIAIIESEIFELSDEKFNISSPKQLGKILFEKLDLPVIKKTKTGYSTNAEVLEELKDKHPIIEKVLYYRQLTKLYSTYVEGLRSVIDSDGKIHSSFNQAVTTTGRLSSTEPNLQNIPIKYEMGRAIRKVFVAENSQCVILSADYSQIELRVLAEIAGDSNMIEAFIQHTDIHTKTASEVFNVPLDQVTPLMRGNAKAVNFGIVYGIGSFSLAKDLKISMGEAKNYIEAYFERYPMVKKYMVDIIVKAKEDLYVSTIMNRRRYIPEIKGPNKMLMSLGERLAMNAPIQGSAADIIKLAMVNVFNELNVRKLKSTLILQVHDELLLNVYKDELIEVKALVKEKMENVLSLSVPLEVDINVGETWYEAK